jgi:uncharacterized membrane protein
MKTVNKLKLLAYNLFLVVNPFILIVAFIISFFSDNYVLKTLNLLHWVFVVTFLLAIPQLYSNYKKNSR